jgi:hypothetical protein
VITAELLVQADAHPHRWHQGDNKMTKYARIIPIVLALGTANITSAEAGCLKGAVVGGVAGHLAHHHAVMGAIAGCAVGHHMAVEKKREEQQRLRAHEDGHDVQGHW